MRNPWLDIPLADYEGHMALPAIGQAAMLAAQFESLLGELSPHSLAVIGCAGGNGFDCINVESTKRVVGIDINPHYIATLAARYSDKIPGLELYVADIQESVLSVEPVDFIYAGLVFEHVAPVPTLRNLVGMCRPNAMLAVVLQLPSNTVAAVSPSPFTSLRVLASGMHLVSPIEFAAAAGAVGFAPQSSSPITLASGKEFVLEVFRFSQS